MPGGGQHKETGETRQNGSEISSKTKLDENGDLGGSTSILIITNNSIK